MKRKLISEEIKKTVREVESYIVKKKYREVSSACRNSRLTEHDIEDVIKNYGGQITLSPISLYDDLSFVKVKDSEPAQYRVDFDLWIDDKQSDLTLSLSIAKGKDNRYIATLDDIHVL